MRTEIEFNFDGKHYDLFLTAAALRKAERVNGFNVTKIDERSLSTILDVFCMAFEAKHPDVSRAEREAIFDALGGKNEDEGKTLGEVLLKMLNEAVEDCTAPKGSIMWSVKK